MLKMIKMSEKTKLKITVLHRIEPSELFDKLPVTPRNELHACGIYEGNQEFIIEGNQMPEGFCSSAWMAINPTVKTFLYGGSLPWYKEQGVSVTCCLDGLRPVIFKIERM